LRKRERGEGEDYKKMKKEYKENYVSERNRRMRCGKKDNGGEERELGMGDNK